MPATPNVNAASQAQTADSQRHLSLRCPKCEAEGRIDWSALGRAIDCHRCTCRFLVLRGGKAVALDDLPQRPFACPRCRTTGSMASLLAVRGTACPRCKLPLAVGPDDRLYSVEEATRLRRLAGRSWSKPSAARTYVRSFLTTSEGRWRMDRLAICCVLAVSLATLAVMAARAWFDHSPETYAGRLVRLCLAGDADRADRYLAADDVQQVEFQRWHLRHLSSLRDEFRPAGDSITIDAATVVDHGGERRLEVVLSSPAIGTRKLSMQWRLEDDRWTFDAAGTLAEADRQAMRRPDRPARRGVPGRRPISPSLVPSGL